MALTPLTVTRRNVIALDFTETTLVPGTSTGVVGYYAAGQSAFPHIVGSGPDGETSIAEGGTGDRMTHIFVNGDGGEFGIYYEGPLNRGVGSATYKCALNRAQNAFVLTNNLGDNPSAPKERAFHTVSADINDIVLSESTLPPDGVNEYPTGYDGVGGGSDAYYPTYNDKIGTDVWGIMAVKVSDSSFRLITMTAGNEYKAFVSDGDFYDNATQTITLSDASFNYTLLAAEPQAGSGNTLYMSKWTAEATTDPFSYTNYSIELSDAADDAILQAAADWDYDDLFMIRGNYENFWIFIADNDSFPLTSATAFVFAKDFTWYDRLDITSNGDISFGVYWQDIEGNHFLVGAHQTAGTNAFQLIQAEEGGAVEDEDTNIRVWPFSLDGHDFAVFRLGSSEGLICDLSTDQWARWISPDVNRWRPHVGQNWSGMGPVTWARGFGSDVVCGDDTLGVLYILDPVAGMDDDPVTGTATEFTRKVTGLVTANGRETIGCGAVTLQLAKGDPAQVGAAITLRTSDDWGNTWVSHGSKTITASEWDAVIEWRALGRIKAPGRIFELTDNGASVRINSADMR